MKQVPIVIVVVVAAVTGSSVESASMFSGPEFEPALLLVWGLALLAAGQRIKARSRQDVRPVLRPEIAPAHVQPRAHAA